jgi:ribonucleoside-diphosphate reductase alpha chain
MALAPEQTGIGIRRFFTTPDVHPYDAVEWERRDARITNYVDGSVAFEQTDVEFPVGWSLNATNIVAQKYFRGTLGTPEREWSLRQVADRVADTITEWGLRDGYFTGDDEAETFRAELKHLIITQKGAFNSPVWFNIGVEGVPQQASACQPYDALVSTPDGLVPIGELVEQNAVGAKVFDANGVTKVVAVKHNGTKPVLRVHTKAGYTLDVTSDHFVWRASGRGTGAFVQAGQLEPGQALEWHRVDSWGDGQFTTVEMSEAALAGWLQSDGFVGQYDHGTNKSLTLEFLTVTDAEHEWVTYALDQVFPDHHRKVRRFETQSEDLVGRRIRLYGEELREFVEKWELMPRGTAMAVPQRLFAAPQPVVASYLRSMFQADGYVSLRERGALVGLDLIAEQVVRGVQQLLGRFGIYSRVRRKRDRRSDRHDLWSLAVRPRPDRQRFGDELGFVDPDKAMKLIQSTDLPGKASGDVKRLEIQRIEQLGEMEVYDIQTESGEYLSGGLRVHNCFILAVDDKMDSILNWYVEEGTIFKGGSGSGINLSRIRASQEILKGGGTASGPVSFMRGADASAGTIKSGGKTRRAAKMVILDSDHPDVEEFIWCKAKEEQKARVLRDSGFDMDLDGADSHSIQYQNANNSVRVTDDFMRAVENDDDWHLTARTDGSVLRTVKARDLFRQVAQAAWECADPGMQFDTTINHWHTAANTGRINGSNPCSEYMHLDNSACNLASLNLLKFLDDTDTFDVDGFKAAVEVVFTAQEILVGNADYPTEPIGETSRRFRQLGLGYANLGAMLMALGLPYDSDEGRAWAGAITSLMTGHAYAVSARTASRMGPFAGHSENEEHMLRVLDQHREASYAIDDAVVPEYLLTPARQAWENACGVAAQSGVRNSQASVLAPTGCLVGGTLVPTDRGLVRLRSLGDPDGAQWQDLAADVQTDEGTRAATQFYVNGLEQVVDVVTERGHRIQGTTKHRVKVVDETGQWVWRRFADLRSGDAVPLALDQLIGVPQTVALPPMPEGYHWSGEHHVSAPRRMSLELAELLGYFMGDGSLHAKGLRLCVADGDFDVIERIEQLAKGLFGIPTHLTPKQGYVEVALNSVQLVGWWAACGFAKRLPHDQHRGKGYSPHIPDAVLHSNDREVYAAFVRGLFEADGTVTAGYPSWSTVTIDFSHDVQSLLLALGYPTTRRFTTSGRGSTIAILRLLNQALAPRWLDEVGFMSGRKCAAVDAGDHPQAARYDHIPVTRQLIDRVVPDNGRERRVALMEHSRSRSITRRLAREMYERSGDAELGHLLGFFFDRVASAELGDEELTYDLSVPDNVTYVANGFVSHNTIGLMMDCDTTGIEPDLGLVKMKKLVGGGTMSIVNQTVPRALRRLGYDPGQIDEIIAYIDQQKSILGAPLLEAAHLPVFACSMGDNTIHYRGHIRMMGATQPFLSGAISKTINMPEEATVEEVEALHMESWKLGIKAVAIYRDNCKVAQPLATAKKDLKEADSDAAANAAATEVVERVVEKIVREPFREKLPRDRRGRTFEFRVADCKGFVTVGEYDDGRPGEIFIRVSKQGSTLAGIMDSFAIAISHGLQYGVALRSYVDTFTGMRFEPAGMTDDPDIRIATSLMDYLFRKLALFYLSKEERAELGIFSTEERMQPTLPGVEETVVETSQGSDIPADPPSVPSASTLTAQFDTAPSVRTPDAPICMTCGVQMQRAGSCHACPSCGSTSGCS